MSDWYGANDRQEPRGLLDFVVGGGRNSGLGADIGDSLGVVSQILMNLGSGRGGAGIGEAMSGLSDRREKRRDRKQLTDMAYRMADKLETSNPELSEVLRSDPYFGMKLLGQKYEQDWRNDAEMSQLKEREKLQSDAAIALEDRKQAARDKEARLNAEVWGLGSMLPPTARTASAGGGEAPVPATALGPNTTTLGQGEGEIQATPIGTIGEGTVPPPTGGTPQPPVVAQPGPSEPVSNVLKPRYDYTKGLPDDPQQARILLEQRKKFQDPDMPWEAVLQLYKGATNKDQVGLDAFLADVEKRKAVRKREWDFRSEVASPVGPMGPIPETQAILQGAKIPIPPPATDPAAQQVQEGLQDQQAEFLKQAYAAGPEEYQAALKSQLPSDEMGLTVTTNADGSHSVTYAKGGGKGGKATESQANNELYATLGKQGEVLLNSQPTIDALTKGRDPLLGNLPPWVSNRFTSNEYKNGVILARNFVANLLRKVSGAEVKDSELERYWYIFIPTHGEGPEQVAIKKDLRDAALEGIGKGRSTNEVVIDAIQARRDREAAAKGGQPAQSAEPTVPTSETDPSKGGEPSDDDLLKLYPQKGG